MRPKHHDFTTEAQRHKDEREVLAMDYPWKTAKNPKKNMLRGEETTSCWAFAL